MAGFVLSERTGPIGREVCRSAVGFGSLATSCFAFLQFNSRYRRSWRHTKHSMPDSAAVKLFFQYLFPAIQCDGIAGGLDFRVGDEAKVTRSVATKAMGQLFNEPVNFALR